MREDPMTVHEPVRLELRERPSRIAIVRDVAIILVCAAILLGTIADVLFRARDAPARGQAEPAASVSL
jgi:hypothetical protein